MHRQILTKYNAVISRFYATLKNAKILKKNTNSMDESISSWYMRPYKPYKPTINLNEDLLKICRENNLPEKNYSFKNMEEKSKFLEICFRKFQHGIPNSLLHKINSIDDTAEFYKTPVNISLPITSMKNIDLPENLHIVDNYKRFTPEDDTKFKGQTAFPKSSTLVTGLKYKKKYIGHTAKTSWP